MSRRRTQKEPVSGRTEVALLVDGDNIMPAVLAPLIERTEAPITERRIWRNWRSTRDSKEWDAVSKELGCERVDRYNTRKEGKNASDIALAVGAMDLYHQGYRSFIIVSGDTDFVPLVERLRRGGSRVVMVGHHPDADLLIQVSDEYLSAADLLGKGGRGAHRAPSRGPVPAEKAVVPKTAGREPSQRQEKALRAVLLDAHDACMAEGRADDEGWVSVDTLGKMIHAKHKGFRLTRYDYPSSMGLKDAYRSFKDAFVVHSMEAKGGNRKRYRVRQR